MKSFLSAEDIEAVAEKGQRELIVDRNTVLTDVARHTADMLGVALIQDGASAFGATVKPIGGSTAPPAQSPAGSFSGKPKGCQSKSRRGPRASTASSSGPVIDQLVNAVSRINGNK